MVLVLFHDPDLRRCLGPPKASFWILVSHYIQKSASQDKGEGLLNILMMVISKTVMNEKSIQSVRDAKKKGENQYKDFVKERIIKTEKSIHDVIKRNKLPLFRQKNSVVTSNSKLQVTSLKQDCSLYASLYVACQTRECDLDEFFSHENHSYPPSLSQYGRVRQTAKSDCIKIFSKYAEVRYQEPDITALVIDGAALVQMLPPRE